MVVKTSYIKSLTIIVVILTMATGCSNAFLAKRVSLSVHRKNLNSDTREYFDQGYTAATHEYSGIGPLLTGTLTGMTLPAAVGGAGGAANELMGNGGAHGNIAGVGGLVLWTWGGNELAKLLPQPTSDHHTTSLSADEQQAFDDGFTHYINARRSANYWTGVWSGIAIDLIAIMGLIAGFGIPGGV